jgi:hypothetical protein
LVDDMQPLRSPAELERLVNEKVESGPYQTASDRGVVYDATSGRELAQRIKAEGRSARKRKR